MASRRLISSSLSLRRRTPYHSFPSPLSCLTVPHKRREHEEQHYFTPNLVIRPFSTAEQKQSSYRDRARAGATRGATAARKGAKSATEMMRQYGPVFVGTYTSLYFITWGSLFVGMDSGVIDPVQIMGWIHGGMEESKSTVHLVVEYMEKFSWTRPYAPIIEKNPHFANLGVAWVTTKFTEPLRLMITIGIVPRLARHFGFVPPKEAMSDQNVEADAVEDGLKEETDESPEKRKPEQ